MKTLTRIQIYNICKENKYVIFREFTGYGYGHNCKLGELLYKKYSDKPNTTTDFVSFKPCDLNEYITYKIPMNLHKFKR